MDRQGAVATLKAALAAFVSDHAAGDERWCVALSGGADSLALTAAAAAAKPTTALIVDHRLQPDSGRVAATARDQALSVGCVDAVVLCVEVGTTGGPEAAARTARYRALEDARGDAPVLLAHTLDDQAETVLLGLGRGSGARSIAGMRPYDPPWYRPLLGVRRALTHAACGELGLTPWHDPHNADRRFTRTRLRTEVLPLLEEVLGGGVAEALARTATALREDTDTLDELARQALAEVGTGSAGGGGIAGSAGGGGSAGSAGGGGIAGSAGGGGIAGSAGGGLDTARLAALPEAIRRRVIRGWLLAGGASGLTDKQIRGVDILVTGWRGQGGVAVGSPLRSQRLIAGRRDGMLTLHTEPV